MEPIMDTIIDTAGFDAAQARVVLDGALYGETYEEPDRHGLTPRQAAFCRYVAVGASGAEAARKAGYSQYSARRTASRLLADDQVLALVDAFRRRIDDDRAAERRRLEAVLDEIIRTGLEADGLTGHNGVLRAVTLKAKLLGLLAPPRQGAAAAVEGEAEAEASSGAGAPCGPPVRPAAGQPPIEDGGPNNCLRPAAGQPPLEDGRNGDPSPQMTTNDHIGDVSSHGGALTGGGAAAQGRDETIEEMAMDAPEAIRLAPGDNVPNNPDLPVLVYRGVLRGGERKAAAVRRRFAAHGWGAGGWVGGIFDWPHYHAETHEALAFLRGRAQVRLGGDGGPVVGLGAGDVCVLPAGTGHQCLEATGDLAVVGGYPDGAQVETIDASGPDAETLRAAAAEAVATTPTPTADPLAGSDGPLARLWGGNRSG
jgi:uncharacterized protein YjlB